MIALFMAMIVALFMEMIALFMDLHTMIALFMEMIPLCTMKKNSNIGVDSRRISLQNDVAMNDFVCYHMPCFPISVF